MLKNIIENTYVFHILPLFQPAINYIKTWIRFSLTTLNTAWTSNYLLVVSSPYLFLSHATRHIQLCLSTERMIAKIILSLWDNISCPYPTAKYITVSNGTAQFPLDNWINNSGRSKKNLAQHARLRFGHIILSCAWTWVDASSRSYLSDKTGSAAECKQQSIQKPHTYIHVICNMCMFCELRFGCVFSFRSPSWAKRDDATEYFIFIFVASVHRLHPAQR